MTGKSVLPRREFLFRLSALVPVVSRLRDSAYADSGLGQRYVLLEFFDPRASRTAQFEVWWPIHLKKMLVIPGFLSAERFERNSVQLRRPSAAPLPSHLGVYNFSARDLATILHDIKTQRAVPSMAVDAKTSRAYVYRETGSWLSSGPTPEGDFFRQLVFANALPYRDAEFNRWYDEIHTRDLLTVPGIVAVSRLVLVGQTLNESLNRDEAPPQYLSMMDFRTTSVEQFGGQLDSMGEHFKVPMLSTAPMHGAIYIDGLRLRSQHADASDSGCARKLPVMYKSMQV